MTWKHATTLAKTKPTETDPLHKVSAIAMRIEAALVLVRAGRRKIDADLEMPQIRRRLECVEDELEALHHFLICIARPGRAETQSNSDDGGLARGAPGSG